MYKCEKFVLNNGIRIVVAPTDHNEIALWLFIRGGSQYEKKEESGISHFIEHIIFRGTRRWPTYRLIDDEIEKISQQNGCRTGLEEISYFLRVQPRYFNEALDLMSDWVAVPTFRPADIEKEKELVPQEIRRGLDNPAEYVRWELWREVCFDDHPAGRPICGNEETIRNFSESQVKRFFEKTYVGSRIVLAIVGDLKKDAIFEKIQKFFFEIKTGIPENPTPIKIQQKSPKSLIFYKDTQQTHLAIGFKTPFRSGSTESYAANVLANILRRNIYLLLIGEKGIAYSTLTDYSQDSTKSFIRSYVGIGHDKVEEVILSILDEYKKMAQGNIGAQDVDKSARSIIKDMRTSFSMDPLELAHFFGAQELFTGKILSPREEFRIYNSLTVEQLQELAKTIFTSANLNLAIIGPHPNQDKFQKLMGKF